VLARHARRAKFDIAQHLRRVGCMRNERRRRRQMKLQDVASATDWPASRDGRLRLFSDRDTGSARASGRGLPK